MNIIIAGIHTGIGKTVCSAVICQALGYDYWKPVQAGELNDSDSIFIKRNVEVFKNFILSVKVFYIRQKEKEILRLIIYNLNQCLQ